MESDNKDRIDNERKKESEVAQSCSTLCNPMDCSQTPWNVKSSGP